MSPTHWPTGGDIDLAFEWLGKAATSGAGVSMAAVHPFLLKLHDDPRWLPFLESIGKSPAQLSGWSHFFIQMSEYLADHHRVFDAGNDPDVATASGILWHLSFYQLCLETTADKKKPTLVFTQ